MMAKNGDSTTALIAAQGITIDAGAVIHRIASEFVARRDEESFKKLLLPAAFFTSSAYVMIGLLAKLYPSQVESIVTSLPESLNRGGAART